MDDTDTQNEKLLSELEALRARITLLEQESAIHAEVESTLRLELAMTRQYLDLAGVILIALDTQGDITLINAKGCAILGWDKNSLIGQNWFDTCLPPDERTRVRDVFRQLVTGNIKSVEFFENPVLMRSGEQRLIVWRNTVLTDEEGQIIGVLSSGEDMTEHRQAQEALRESTKRYRNLYDEVSVGLYTTTREGQIVDANATLVDMLGYPDRASLLANKVQDLFAISDMRQAEQDLVTSEGGVHRFQMQLRRYDGTIIWVEDNVQAIRDGEGQEYYKGSLTDITIRKRAELALLESETRFRSIAQAAPDAIITANSQGHIVFWNDAAEAMFGYRTNEVIYQSLTQIIPARHRQRHREGMARFLATKNSAMIGKQVELVGLRHDGSEFPLELTLAAWGVGENTFFSAILRDITERKQAEETLRESQRFLKTLISNTPGMVYRCHNNHLWTMAFVSEGCLELTGYAPSDLVDNRTIAYSQLIHEADRQQVWNTIQQALREQKSFQLTYRIITRDQQEKWVWEQGQGTGSTEDAALSLEGLVIDVTPQVMAKHAEHEQRLRAETTARLFEALNRATDLARFQGLNLEQVLQVVVSGLVDEMSVALARIWLFEEATQELIPRASAGLHTHLNGTHARLRVDDDRVKVSAVARSQQLLMSNHIQDDEQFDRDWVTAHGLVAFAGYPLLRNEQLVGVLAVFSQARIDDMLLEVISLFVNQAAIAIENAHLYQELENYSEYLQQAVNERTEELYNSIERIETILNSIDEALLVAKPDGRIDQVNPAFERQTGYAFHEVEMRQLKTLFAASNSEATISESMAAIKSGQPWRGEMDIIRKDGTSYEVLLTSAPVMTEQGVPLVFVVSLVDISDQKRNEQTLRQALEREIEVSDMRTRFLSMATHDLRNPLAVIRSSIDMLAEYYDRMSPEKREAKLVQIQASISYMVELLDDILIIGRAETGRLSFNPEPIELESFCHSIVAEIQASIGTNHNFDFALTGKRLIRLMDPKLLRHILYNLLSNAVKYSPSHSTITFELESDATQTMFCIQDEGIGIPEDDLPRLFEAFHRASNVGARSGTGLGLAIVKQSTELHGGTVICETQHGEGTTFIVTLPTIVPEETL
jgi:PAS domain S-box-containing protein